MIKVAVYEDNKGLREVLTTIIRESSEFELAGEFGHCLDILTNTKAFQPNVILMDIDMPFKSGIEGASEVKKEFPHIEILMNTVFDDDDRIFDSIKAGASGYLLKKNSLMSLLSAIKDVATGGAPMSPSIARKVIEFQKQLSGKKGRALDLNDREFQILSLLSRGNSYKMVAEEVNLSIDTIRSHVKKIYEKLHVHSVTEAIHKVFIDKI
jgi:DNA-binding NarL/FixJ family response regulator